MFGARQGVDRARQGLVEAAASVRFLEFIIDNRNLKNTVVEGLGLQCHSFSSGKVIAGEKEKRWH